MLNCVPLPTTMPELAALVFSCKIIPAAGVAAPVVELKLENTPVFRTPVVSTTLMAPVVAVTNEPGAKVVLPAVLIVTVVPSMALPNIPDDKLKFVTPVPVDVNDIAPVELTLPL